MNEKLQTFPDFNLQRDGGTSMSFKDLKGKNAVIYFYPKDNTPGCTTEAIEFTEFLADFEKLDTVIIGVSPDTVKKHDNFINKHNLKVILLADEERQLIEELGLWVEKKMYGKTYFGVERSTFVLDKNGKILKSWRKVKVKGHVDEVLAFVKDNLA